MTKLKDNINLDKATQNCDKLVRKFILLRETLNSIPKNTKQNLLNGKIPDLREIQRFLREEACED